MSYTITPTKQDRAMHVKELPTDTLAVIVSHSRSDYIGVSIIRKGHVLFSLTPGFDCWTELWGGKHIDETFRVRVLEYPESITLTAGKA